MDQPDTFTPDAAQQLTLAAAGTALAAAVGQDAQRLRETSDEQVVALAGTAYRELEEEQRGQGGGLPWAGELAEGEGRRVFIERFAAYYRRVREVCGGDPERFDLLRNTLSGHFAGPDVQVVALYKQMIVAAFVPSREDELPAIFAGVTLEPHQQAFWALLLDLRVQAS